MPHMERRAPRVREWHTSRYSTNGGDCAEARIDDNGVDLRDSKNPDGPALRFTPDEWVALYLGMINGDPNVAPPAEWIARFQAKRAGSPTA